MSPDEEAIFEGFENKEEFFLVKPGYVKSFGEDQEMKSSSKSLSKRRLVEKKAKVIWTKDLHKKFLEAVEKLGIDKAVPKKIVQLMKVDGLTRDHVASHLQKHRILSKKIANADHFVQTASKPSLLDGSITTGFSWSHSSLMLNNQEQMNLSSSGMHAISPLILDTSSIYFSGLDASHFNSTNNGYSMQAMTNNLDEQRNFIDNTTNSGVVSLVNTYNSGFVQNLDAGFFHDYKGCSTEAQKCNNFEKGSSDGVQYSCNPSFVQNSTGFETNYSSQNEFIEKGSLYGVGSNTNLESTITEDDLILSDVDIAYLISFADDYNRPISHDPPHQEMNGPNSPNMFSFYSNHEEHTSIKQQQTLDAYLPGFDPTFDAHMMDEQFKESVRSPDLLQTIQQFKF